MLDKLKEFFDNEYKSTKRWIESPYGKQYKNKKDAINYALQRGLGASYFAESIGSKIEYKRIEELYNEYKEKIKRLEMIKPWEDEKTGKIFCPVNGWDCPYYKEHGICSLENVQDECDSFYNIWADEIEAERRKKK